MVWPAGSACNATETLDKILIYTQLHAPMEERSTLTRLVSECMSHPAAGIDANGFPYTETDHCDSVDAAWDSIRDGRDDWDAAIEELEHLGSTGDITARVKNVPVLTKADELAAKHFARRLVMYKWSPSKIRKLIGKYEAKIAARHKKRLARRARLAKKKKKKKKKT